MNKQQLKKTGLNFETIGSIAAMVIGGSALFVAWDQAQVMRAQQHASVWPIVSADLNVSGDNETRFLRLAVSNAGVGPALIESAKLTVNGEQTHSLSDFGAKVLPEGLNGKVGFGGTDVEGGIVASGQEVTVIQLIWQRTEEIDAVFNEFALSFVRPDAPVVLLEVCYCSVFDKCWTTVESGRPESVQSCPAATGLLSNFATPNEQPATNE